MTDVPTPPPEGEKVATPAPKPTRGRPSKLTPAVQEEICRAIAAAHVPLADAALLAGVSYDSLNRWIQKGKAQKRGKYSDFCKAVARARAEAKASSLAGIKAAARRDKDPDWKADAWLLERSFQGEYSPRVYVHVEAQLRQAVERFKEAFDALPPGRMLSKEEALAIAIDALTGDRGPSGTGAVADGEDAAGDSAGGEAVRAPPAEPEAASVPEPVGG